MYPYWLLRPSPYQLFLKRKPCLFSLVQRQALSEQKAQIFPARALAFLGITNCASVSLSLFCSVDSSNALGTMKAFPDTKPSRSRKKSERSKMKSTTITRRKSSGSQVGMKMKATPRGRRSVTVPNCCFSPQRRNSNGLEAWRLTIEFRQTAPQYEPTVSTAVWALLRSPRLLLCRARMSDCWHEFFVNCLNLTLWVAFGVADSQVPGKAPPRCAHLTSSRQCPWKKAHVVTVSAECRSELPPQAFFPVGLEDLQVDGPPSQDSAVGAAAFPSKVLS